MKLSRQSRIAAALIVLMSILFAQIAVAAYACPSTQLTQAVAAIQEQHASTDPAHSPDCEETDSDSPVLCHAHGQVGTQSLDKPPVPNVSPFAAVTLLAAIIQVDKLPYDGPYENDPLILHRATSPPLSIRNCCFRI